MIAMLSMHFDYEISKSNLDSDRFDYICNEVIIRAEVRKNLVIIK